MTVGSLFSGIGGLDLGFQWAGYTIRWQVEIDPWCRAVLAKHWPDVKRYDDVKTCGAHNLEPVDVIVAGFPCQPVSVAGRRRGRDDHRWLWPECGRILRELRPRCAVLENVPGLFSRGFGDVLGDLAACGYDAEWDCLPAAAFGAPHLRYRVFIVAYPQCDGIRQQSVAEPRGGDQAVAVADGTAQSLADASSDGWQPRRACDAAEGQGRREPRRGGRGANEMADANSRRRQSIGLAEPARLEGACGRVFDGRGSLRKFKHATNGDWWRVEPDVDRVAHGVPARVDRLRGLGNAVVPQVAQWIAERIKDII